MTDFLLELRSEEIPARMQDRARDDLARLFAAEVAKAGLAAEDLTTYATPRRLTLIARGLADATDAVATEVKGPRASAPPQALEGFLRKTGLTRDQLTERDGILYAVTETPGRATAEVLAEAIPAIFRAFPWPKSMRWGDLSVSTESPRWVRPVQGVVAMLGADVVPCTVAGVPAGATTLGHRFHHPGPITLGGAADYQEKLRACHVIVDQEERRVLIRARAAELADAAGLTLVEDEGLVAENAGLTEWPVPLLGRFDPAFLSVPPEVIQLTARVNQKYFVCRDGAGTLADAFICVANIDAPDGGAKIADGNRKVLAARLSDARFFYETDIKTPLDDQAAKLDRIVFHEKLGTVADKVDRVAKLARWLVEEGVVTPRAPANAGVQGDGHEADPGLLPTQEHLADLAERAARLCKADLVTGMVGEFPELQGVMGGYYAAAQGEHPAVAEAIRDHYKPVGQGDDVPTAPITVAVSLADKLDTISNFFFEGLKPSGSRDPFALRRQALGFIAQVQNCDIRISLSEVLTLQMMRSAAYRAGFAQGRLRIQYERSAVAAGEPARSISNVLEEDELISRRREEALESAKAQALSAYKELIAFLADRLKVQQREAGVRHDLIDAVFALGGEDDLVRLLARVRALQAFVGTDDGANLLTGYRRAANILKKEGYVPSTVTPAQAGVPAGEGTPALQEMPAYAGTTDYVREPAESALIAALDAAEPAAAAAVEREEFEAAMTALASLRHPIDRFFDDVTVNDPDPARRAARLALLARVRDAVHRVADFSRIEG